MTEVLKERWRLNPHEVAPQTGDLVTLSDYELLWNVTKVARNGSVVYLRSVLGNRSGTESTARLRTIWRDPNAIAEIDWSAAYEEEEE